MPWKLLEAIFAGRLEEVLKTFSKCLEDVLKTPRRRFCKTSWIRFEGVLKMSWSRFCKTSWKCLENLLKTYGRGKYIGLNQNVLKTSSEDVWLREIYSSWSRYLEDVLKTSSEDEWLMEIYSSWSRHLEDVLNTCSEGKDERRLHQDECLLGIHLEVF